jgi:hypothetical protein
MNLIQHFPMQEAHILSIGGDALHFVHDMYKGSPKRADKTKRIAFDWHVVAFKWSLTYYVV